MKTLLHAATPRQNALLALLTFSAIVLAVLLVVLPAKAEVSVTAGDFTLATVANGIGGDQAVTIVDQRAQRMIIYMMQQDRLTVIGAADLGAGFNPGAPTPAPTPPSRR